ncbi:MAG: YgiQ family radical SAM protein [Planctomycetes bacterium]|nr:YgiQ family radical SAM protein [Planctomycetota bacterium]
MSTSKSDLSAWLPTTRAEMDARGWDRADIVFVTGDAYVDHPSFAMAILGRVLEREGFRVAILAQPDWRSKDAWTEFGPPRLFWAVSAGNMDSMINHYTANKKRRNADAYSPGGAIGLRPDRPTPVYAQRCREACKDVPVVIGGVEASLRRIAHFDYWSETVRPSMLVSSKADLLAYGMGERTIVEIARRLDAGASVHDLRSLRGVAYLLGKNESLELPTYDVQRSDGRDVTLPSHELVQHDMRAFADMTRLLHHETNPWSGRRLVQEHGDRRVVINPPDLPLSPCELDACHELPYTRRPHPRYREPIPAWTTIKDSVQIMRGCFGGCTFCSITMHQGRAIQSRTEGSILRELEQVAKDPDFKGHVSDLGGPTANMWQMKCTKPEVEAICRRLSCVHPTVCKLLDTSHAPTVRLMQKARAIPGIERVHIASGIRMDLARGEERYLDELVKHHVGGHLKVAPEHVSDRVLTKMKKPAQKTFEEFDEAFREASKRAGKDQYLVPYFIASHPGSTTEDMIELAIFLKAHGYKPRQVQDFIPAPMDIATCMYFTGLDPMTMQPVDTVTKLRDRKVQRALLQFFAPENWFVVRKALIDHGRKDLIGNGKHCLIPEHPPKEARDARRKAAKDSVEDSGAGSDARARAGYRRASRTRGSGRGARSKVRSDKPRRDDVRE